MSVDDVDAWTVAAAAAWQRAGRGTRQFQTLSARANADPCCYSNNHCHTSHNPNVASAPITDSIKHLRQRSRELDDNEDDVCPTTPTRSTSLPQWGQSAKSPLRRSFANEGALAALSGVHLPDVGGVPGPNADANATAAWGLRRRSVNTNGERPSLDGSGFVDQSI